MAKLQKPLPHQIRPLPVLLGGAIILFAWLSSDDQPEGCYQIDATTHIVIADGKARLLGKHGGEARIIAVDRVRGWVLKLDHRLKYDPARASDARFVRGNIPSQADALFIDHRSGNPPAILFHPDRGADVRFPQVACNSAPKG